MKFNAIKAAVAICLLVPVMAMAKIDKPVTTTFSYTFSDMADTNVNIGKNATGFLSYTASWKDLLSGFSSMVETQASSLTWALTAANGKTVVQQGTFADVAGDSNKGLIVLNESLLGKGEYKLTLSGTWSGIASGIKGNWEHQDVKVSLGGKTFSALNPVSPVPEPESYAMLLAGLGLMGTIALRRKKSDVS
jgi:hypothetical protein